MAQDGTTSSNPSITMFPSRTLNVIDRKIYSGFTEHMGRCIYGGLYDPDNPNASLLTPEGFRKDVISALEPLSIPVFRYPGGNFCATYHWLDGVGPRSSRPARPELAWESIEPNAFGTDEFMTWCDCMNAEPYLCLNFGTGTLDEALGWVEYCNGTKNTYYANLRRRNGRQKPYNVRYWALGNEMWGEWQMCQMSPEAYADKAYQWAKALKLLDPSIQLVLCGREGATSWDYTVLKRCVQPAGLNDLGEYRGPLIDMHSIHVYTASETSHYENVFAPLGAERAIEICVGLIDLACIENGVPSTQKRPKICFDEWNVWSPKRAPGSKGAEEKYTLSDALAVAVWLNVLVRKSADLGMANIAQSVNVISPLMTREDGIVKQTSWHVYELFCRFMKGRQIAVDVDGVGEYKGSTKPDWVRTVKRMSWLDAAGSVDSEGWVNLTVVNTHMEDDIAVELQTVRSSVTAVDVYTVTGSDLAVTNMDGAPKVGIDESKYDCRSGRYVFRKHSFTLLRWKL